VESILLAINWNVHPDMFELPFLGRPVRYYGLCWALAFLFGHQLMKKMFKADGVEEDWLDKILIYVMIGSILGARLGHVFFYDWSSYKDNPISILFIWEGGLASHGGAIGVIVAAWLFSRNVSKKSILWILDRIVITGALAGVFIRIGNLMNHEIVGKPTDVSWGFMFKYFYEPNGGSIIPRHPVQIYEAIAYLITFLILYRLFWKTTIKEQVGRLFGLFCMILFTARFIMEFFKRTQADFIEDGALLNMGQMLSIPLILVGAYIYFFRKYPKSEQERISE